jgi:hypothetical protein
MQLTHRPDIRKMHSFTVCKLTADSAVISLGYETVQNMSAFEASRD